MDDEELYCLWQREDWKSLAAARATRGAGWPVKLVARLQKRDPNGPEMLMAGIALIENGQASGDAEKGRGLIKQYQDKSMHFYTNQWHALVYYYLGVEARENGNLDLAAKLFGASEQFCRCPVLQQRLHSEGVECFEESGWPGRAERRCLRFRVRIGVENAWGLPTSINPNRDRQRLIKRQQRFAPKNANIVR